MRKETSVFDRLRSTRGWKAVIQFLRIVEAVDVLVVVLFIFEIGRAHV